MSASDSTGVGDERVGMAEDARDEFCRRERDIHRQPDEGGAQAALEAVGLHAKLLTTKHGKGH